MVTVVAPLGLSPPVVTEFVQWLESNGIDIDSIVLVETNEVEVLAGAKLVKVALELRYPRLKVKELILGYPDVDDQERALDFLKEVSEIVGSLRPKKVYLLISGGRKAMSVAVALISQFFPSEVYHVVSKNVKIVNLELERLRAKINELYESEDPQAYYRANEDLEKLMFPNLGDYKVIRIPTIPYPDQVLSEVRRALEGTKVKDLSFNIVPLLSEVGLVQLAGGRTVATDMGKKVLEILERI
ncbi:MAG: CRISPR-associated ring nuclease [Candidatus Korarchaeum sp.]|nr:CRISPR-associated ring nuclease [Candidatus Korarchaeum sp.]MDW8035929.1 CRISPR-associated ring nuclease [Candidatus Korarchaeum sp.]